MVRACVGIVAVLLVAACGQRGPLVLPQAARGVSASQTPQAPAGVPEPFLHSAPLSPAISDSPDPNVSSDAFGAPGVARGARSGASGTNQAPAGR